MKKFFVRNPKLLKEQGLPLPKPQTIDSQRTRDETFVSEDDPEETATLRDGTPRTSAMVLMSSSHCVGGDS